MVFSKVGPNQSIEWGQIRISKSLMSILTRTRDFLWSATLSSTFFPLIPPQMWDGRDKGCKSRSAINDWTFFSPVKGLSILRRFDGTRFRWKGFGLESFSNGE
jgi:hypothetical protein